MFRAQVLLLRGSLAVIVFLVHVPDYVSRIASRASALAPAKTNIKVKGGGQECPLYTGESRLILEVRSPIAFGRRAAPLKTSESVLHAR